MPCGTKKDGKGGDEFQKITDWGPGDQTKRAWAKLKNYLKNVGNIASSTIKMASPIDQLIALLKSRQKK